MEKKTTTPPKKYVIRKKGSVVSKSTNFSVYRPERLSLRYELTRKGISLF